MPIHLPTADNIERFGAALRRGELVAFATETVYGLGADATNSDAVLRIYEAKGRPRFNPLILHVDGLEMARRYARFSPLALRLAEFWPGPLTLVLPQAPDAGISDIVTAGLDTVAIRVPGHELARALIRAAGVPIAAPSANPSGRLSPTSAAQVERAFTGTIEIIDGGDSNLGVESTILAVEGDSVTQLRAGALPRDRVEAAIGSPIAIATGEGKVTAPGMLASHYAPNAALRLNATTTEPGETLLGFGDVQGAALNLSAGADLHEAARNLFAMLHRLDETAARIAVSPIPDNGLGEAINDRLQRAAAPRS